MKCGQADITSAHQCSPKESKGEKDIIHRAKQAMWAYLDDDFDETASRILEAHIKEAAQLQRDRIAGEMYLEAKRQNDPLYTMMLADFAKHLKNP